MLIEALAIGFAVFVLFNLILFSLFKSSKKMPTTFRDIKCEVILQIYGSKAITEDITLRSKNVVELNEQPGRVVVITGGNRGLGMWIIEKLLRCQMTVVMGVRDPKTSRNAIEAIIDEKYKKNVVYEQCDVGDMNSVRLFAATVQKKYEKIDILINNAGIMAAPFRLTVDNFESHMAVNYLGHFLLTHLLLPQIKASGNAERKSRIINVSSCVHLLGEIDYDDINKQKHYYPAEAYNQSKLAQVLSAKHIDTMLNEQNANVSAYSLHPGVVDTDLFQHSSTTIIPWFKKFIFKTPEEGSRTVVYAAISPKIEDKGGAYLSNCRLARSHKLVKDAAACKKFFDFTCDMLAIKNFGK